MEDTPMIRNTCFSSLCLLFCLAAIPSSADDAEALGDYCQVAITWANGSQSLMCFEKLGASDEDFREACYQSGMFDSAGPNGPTLEVNAVAACPTDYDGACTVAGGMLRNFHYKTDTNLFNGLATLRQSCIAGRGEWSE